MHIIEYLNSALEIVGAISVICGALSHMPLGKFAAVMGEIGVDLAGLVKEIRK